MNTSEKGQDRSIHFSELEIRRLQDVLDTNVVRPSDLAEHWGICKSSADMCFARMRESKGVHTTQQLIIYALRAGAVTVTYDVSRGDANIVTFRYDSDGPKATTGG